VGIEEISARIPIKNRVMEWNSQHILRRADATHLLCYMTHRPIAATRFTHKY